MLKQKDLPQHDEPITLEQRRNFLKLPLSERNRLLSEQAAEVEGHYALLDDAQQREEWQGGDLVEY